MLTSCRLAVAGCTLLLLASLTHAAPDPGTALLHYVAPRFPLQLRGVKQGDGLVVMTMTVDQSGKVIDSVALEASDDAFVMAAMEALNGWQFAPAFTLTLPRRETVEFIFKRDGVITSLSHAESASEAFVSSYYPQRRTVQWHELDAEPRRIAGDAPRVAKDAVSRLHGRPLLVSFIIDAQGRVRVPIVNATEDREVATAVLQAVQQWRYEIPKKKGQPMAVEVTRSLQLQ